MQRERHARGRHVRARAVAAAQVAAQVGRAGQEPRPARAPRREVEREQVHAAAARLALDRRVVQRTRLHEQRALVHERPGLELEGARDPRRVGARGDRPARGAEAEVGQVPAQLRLPWLVRLARPQAHQVVAARRELELAHDAALVSAIDHQAQVAPVARRQERPAAGRGGDEGL